MRLTFKQFLLEYEFNIPRTNYGYWITDKGDFLVAWNRGGRLGVTNPHEEAAERYFEQNEPGFNFDNFAQLMVERGWVRIVELDMISIEISKNVASRAKNTLKNYIIDRAKYFGSSNRPVIFNCAKFSNNRYEGTQELSTAIAGNAIRFLLG